jgi:predicted molibdopterin-dependent oxidoreductase YjgC
MNKVQLNECLKAMVQFALDSGLSASSIDANSCEVRDLNCKVMYSSIRAVERDLGLAHGAVESLVRAFAGAKKPLVVVDFDKTSQEDLEMLTALTWLTGHAEKRGQAVLGFTQSGNAMGLWQAGVREGAPCTCCESCAPGAETLDAALDTVALSLDQNGYSGIVFAGAASAEAAPFVVCVTPYLTDEVAQLSSVVLPGSTFAETSGSVVNSAATERRLNRAIKPASGKENYQIVLELAGALGHPMEYCCTGCVGKEMRAAKGAVNQDNVAGGK